VVLSIGEIKINFNLREMSWVPLIGGLPQQVARIERSEIRDRT